MKITFLFPSRNRPSKFFKTLDNIQDLSESKDYCVIAALDEDDEFADAYRERIDEYPELTIRWGLSRNKIHACNRCAEDLPKCDILILQSDDMVWEVVGFDNIIRQAFENYFPDFDGVVHFPDSHAKDQLITLSIMGRVYFERFNYLYHPDYANVYCDNEFTEVAKLLNKYIFINQTIYDHHHPVWNMAEWDEQYRKTENSENYQKDHQTFFRRKAVNFDL